MRLAIAAVVLPGLVVLAVLLCEPVRLRCVAGHDQAWPVKPWAGSAEPVGRPARLQETVSLLEAQIRSRSGADHSFYTRVVECVEARFGKLLPVQAGEPR